MRILEADPKALLGELKNTLIFQNLSAEELKRISSTGELLGYSAGETVVTQDSVSRYLYVLLEGSVDIMVRGKEREQIRISSVGAGDVFGEASIFMDVRRTASAIAGGEIRIFSISRERLFEYCNGEPRAGLKIFTFIIYSLLRKLSVINKDLAMERESMVTEEDLEKLKDLFPKTLDEMLKK